jgi:hypothetical protein
MPTDTDIIKKIVDLLPLLNTAIKNVRLYPPSSATVSGAVNRLYLALTNLLSEEDHIFFTESEKSLLICGRSLAQKDQEGLPAVSLLNILLGFGLRSLSFRRGLEKTNWASLSAFWPVLRKASTAKAVSPASCRSITSSTPRWMKKSTWPSTRGSNSSPPWTPQPTRPPVCLC